MSNNKEVTELSNEAFTDNNKVITRDCNMFSVIPHLDQTAPKQAALTDYFLVETDGKFR